MTEAAFAITVERDDGSTSSIPLDFDFADLTQRELAAAAQLDLSLLGELTDEEALASSFVFIRLLRDVPEASWEGFAPFIAGLFRGDAALVEVTDG